MLGQPICVQGLQLECKMFQAFVVNYDPVHYHSLQTYEQILPCFILGKGNGIDVKIMKMLQNNLTASKVEDITRSNLMEANQSQRRP